MFILTLKQFAASQEEKQTNSNLLYNKFIYIYNYISNFLAQIQFQIIIKVALKLQMMQNSTANSAEVAVDEENNTIIVNEPTISTKDENSANIAY